MTEFVHIQAGQWVLTFNEGFQPTDKPMSEHLEMFIRRGGGWEWIQQTEILQVCEVASVSPKTFTVGEIVARRGDTVRNRLYRANVIAAGATKQDMIDLREKFFAIGAETTDRIEAEMYRRIEKFATKERVKALGKIHACLPHLFRQDAQEVSK